MTGYTVHTGSTEKFAAGWDQIFRSGSGKKTAGKKSALKKPARKPAKSKASRKR